MQKILLLEKESSLAQHQTDHNSGVIHAGVYYTPDSLKAKFCLAGNRATKDFCDQHAIRYDACGKMLVATNEVEMERMKALWERTEANGLERKWLSAAELREKEPNIVGLGGIFVPSSGIVNYAEVTQYMAAEFTKAGGVIRYHTKRSVNVCNAPSPAATSAIPIGNYIVSKVKEQIGERVFFATP